MELGGYDCHVIDDDDGDAHIGWQVPEQPSIGVKATRRAAHSNDGKIICHALRTRLFTNAPLPNRAAEPSATRSINPKGR